MIQFDMYDRETGEYVMTREISITAPIQVVSLLCDTYGVDAEIVSVER